MQQLYRIDIGCHYKPARYSSTYYLHEDAKDVFDDLKARWNSNRYDYFSEIPGPQREAVVAKIDALELLDDLSEEQQVEYDKLYVQLDELEDDNVSEWLCRSELVVSEVTYPHVIIDEFEAWDE